MVKAVTVKCMVFEGRMRYRVIIVKYAMVSLEECVKSAWITSVATEIG